MYKQQIAMFWTPAEIDLSQDVSDWEKLTNNERHYISYILAFFAASDGIIVENLALRFLVEIQIPEVRCFYGFQLMMENIHSETYSLLIDTYIKDNIQKDFLLNAVENIPSVKAKSDWAIGWMRDGSDFADRLVVYACVEGIFFSGSFCSIFWLKKRGLLPGLTFSNELIARDEGLHRDFACLLYSKLENRLDNTLLYTLVSDAVQLEKDFVRESLPVALIGMNAEQMCKYIEFVGDHLIMSLGYEPLYNTVNPFEFMVMTGLEGKTNMFEKRIGEYQKVGVMSTQQESFEFCLDAEF